MKLEELKLRGCNVRPIRTGTAVDPALRMQEWREKLACVCRAIRAAAKRGQPYTVSRNTARGVVQVNTNGWYEVDGIFYVTFPHGPKRLRYEGMDVFQADTIGEVCEITVTVEQEIMAGTLDAEIQAMFALSEDQKRRMADGKLINKVARADAMGKKVKMSDRTKVERLLKNPEYKIAYEDARAA